MSAPALKKTKRGRVIARSSDGRVIRAARIYDPRENAEKAWLQTGQALRIAMNLQSVRKF